MRAIFTIFLAWAAPALLAGCGQDSEGAFDIALIAEPDSAFTQDLHLSPAAQHIRLATDAGLVVLNAQGEVVPALAESWAVTEDGLSYIFRMRDLELPDGTAITAEDMRRSLQANLQALEGTSLALDLAPVAEVRAMTSRVVELRLTSPVPDLLLLLAQPELALRREGGGLGPMVLERDGEGGSTAILAFKPPEERGLPEDENWQEQVREIHLTATSGAAALAMFDNGDVDVVLGGGLAQMPLVDTGPLSRGTVRIDPALGLFGLLIRNDEGLLADEALREALAMALDRDALLSSYNVAGWELTTRVVPPELAGNTEGVAERWAELDMQERQSEARRRIAQWRADNEMADASVRIALEDAPGFDLLYRALAAQWQTIGVRLERVSVADGAALGDAELVMVDRVARYPDARWFLNQFDCTLRRGLCSAEADALMMQLREETGAGERAALLAEAEAALTQENIYIPIGSPLRWSLVRGSVETHQANRWAFHPLPYLAQIPR